MELQEEYLYNSMYGGYKAYKTNLKEFSSYALKNFDIVKNMPFPSIDNVPLFSQEGRNLMKIMFLDFFRIHTKDEKLLKKMFREHKIHQLIDEAIPTPKSQYNSAIIKNTELSKKVIFSSMTGNYKDYVSNIQEYASCIAKNPEMVHYNVFDNVRVPAFSKEGFNMFKVSLLDKFRSKSKDEKLMREIFKQEKANNPAFYIF